MQNKLSPEAVNMIAELSERTVYLMGGSFVLGSLFTIFLLLVLDFVRHSRMEKDAANSANDDAA